MKKKQWQEIKEKLVRFKWFFFLARVKITVLDFLSKFKGRKKK